MPKKDLTLTSKFILGFHIVEDMMMPFTSTRELYKRMKFQGDYDSFRAIYYRMQKRGLLQYIKYKENRFVTLTSKGQLEALLFKAQLPLVQEWDGKWRLFIFDIPEDASLTRDKLRRLLKKNNFIQLQGSVFISPYALSAEAIEYLKQTGLIEYIRIMRIDQMDDDRDLKKKFGLK